MYSKVTIYYVVEFKKNFHLSKNKLFLLIICSRIHLTKTEVPETVKEIKKKYHKKK